MRRGLLSALSRTCHQSWLALGLLGGLAAQPSPAVAAELAAVVDQAAELAQWCFDRGLCDEAVQLARRVARVDPHSAAASLPRRVVDAGRAAATPGRAAHLVQKAEREADLRRAIAQCLSAARDDVGARDVALSAALLMPDLPGLGVRLRALGCELLGAYGAAASADVERWRQTLRNEGGGFVNAEPRAGCEDMLCVRTRRYRVLGNVPPDLLVMAAVELEAVYRFWDRLAREAGLPLVDPVEPLRIELYDSRASFDLLVPDRLLRAACAREVAVVGVYSFRERVGCVYLADDTPTSRAALLENARHEAVHQLFHLRVRGRAAVPAEDMPFSWLEEAVCLYCEHRELGETVRAPGCCDDDLRAGARCARSDFDPLARVRRVSQGSFVDAGDYGCAALLADFLLSGDARARFLLHLRSEILERGDAGALLRHLGDEARLREAFEAHAADVERNCGR